MKDLKKDPEFTSAIRYGNPLTENYINRIKDNGTIISDNFDEFIQELVEFECSGKKFWMQHLKSTGEWWIFSTIHNCELFRNLFK